ncbi:MAG: hypothetical protein H0X17_08005 [Deltaproteobacteria bacterium]|nr:hypothetical protein [Deltaproteobacteria bacterium]
MSTPRDVASAPASDAAAKRRWMIGIIITVLFGSFGAVMAWLSYADRAKAPASRRSRPAVEPATTPDRDPPGHGKGRRK